MNGLAGGQLSALGIGRRIGLLLSCLCLMASCSVPNLEPPECDQARDVVREFYSRHFGNNLAFDPESVDAQKTYLTAAFLDGVSRDTTGVDPFTKTDDPPKAFRAGECQMVEPGHRVEFELLLFWKTDTRSDQRAIRVGMENVDGRWLIDSVTK